MRVKRTARKSAKVESGTCKVIGRPLLKGMALGYQRSSRKAVRAEKRNKLRNQL